MLRVRFTLEHVQCPSRQTTFGLQGRPADKRNSSLTFDSEWRDATPDLQTAIDGQVTIEICLLHLTLFKRSGLFHG
jgi:hypothetical protein